MDMPCGTIPVSQSKVWITPSDLGPWGNAFGSLDSWQIELRDVKLVLVLKNQTKYHVEIKLLYSKILKVIVFCLLMIFLFPKYPQVSLLLLILTQNIMLYTKW